MKTGECFYYDDFGNLWLAISYCSEAGEVTTQPVLISVAEQDEPSNLPLT
jgi:hypothetical protein